MTLFWPGFETDVDPGIIERGRSYFGRGLVHELEQLEPDAGEWSALVEGSEVYEVKVTVSGESVDYQSCDCPYYLGPVCKHVVAVLYAVRHELGQDAEQFGGTARLGTSRSGGRAGQSGHPPKMADVLNSFGHDKLADIVTQYARRDRVFKNFILSHAPVSSPSGKEHYRRLIQLSLQLAKDRRGFIDYRSGSRAVEVPDELLDKAVQCLPTDPATSIAISQAAIEELVPALQYADDSNGEIGGSIENALEVLARVPGRLTDPAIRDGLFGYCLEEAVNQRQEGWDWKWDLLEIAGNLIDTDPDQDRLFNLLDQLGQRPSPDVARPNSADDFFSSYNAERIAQVKAQVIKRRHGQVAAHEFMAAHVDQPTMRRQVLAEAAARQDTQTIRELAQAGITADQAWPGLVLEWTTWLWRAAHLESDTAETRRLARQLFLETGEMEYYHSLKATISGPAWSEAYGELLRELEDGRHRAAHLGTLVAVCRHEQDWTRIFEDISQQASLPLITTYHNDLAKYDPAALARLYEQAIRTELEMASGRGQYQQACAGIRRMAKLGSHERARQLVAELVAQYPRRPALLDELRRAL